MVLDLRSLDEMAPSQPGTVPEPERATLPARAPLALFEEDPENPRFEHDAKAFEALVIDVGQRGILQPIVVRPLDGGKLRIRFGARRYRAAVRLGLADAPYVTTEDERQFDDYAQVSENARRAPLQPLELATFIAKKLKQGAKKNNVAQRLQMDPSALTHLLALVGDAPAWLLELYHAHRCRTPQYLYLLRRLARNHPEMVAARCAEVPDVDKHFLDTLTLECSALAIEAAAEKGVVAASITASRSTPGTAIGKHRDQGKLTIVDEEGTKPESGAAHSPDGDATASHGKADALVPDASAGGNAVWPKLTTPRLLAVVGRRKVQVALHLCASSRDKAVVLFDDGSVDEVSLSTIRLTTLSDAEV